MSMRKPRPLVRVRLPAAWAWDQALWLSSMLIVYRKLKSLLTSRRKGGEGDDGYVPGLGDISIGIS